MDLQGRRIIVTGCARGMGAATVAAYLRAGARVAGMDVNQDDGHAAVDAARSAHGGEAQFLPVDVADPTSVETAFDHAVSTLGGLDVLAHPAAIQRPGDASSVTASDWD